MGRVAMGCSALGLMALVPMGVAAPAGGPPLRRMAVTLDFGEDRGQNLGTVFEGRDAAGRVVCGAGFAGLYNTAFRADRLTLQFFLRGGDGVTATFDTLPPPSNDGGTYMFDFDGRVYQHSRFQDKLTRHWDEEAAAWQVDDTFGRGTGQRGEGIMRVAGEVLQFTGGEAWYGGEMILPKPASGFYHNFYYALGYLVFSHNNRDGDPSFSRLHAVPWIPGSGAVDLAKTVALELTYPGETPFAIGQLGDEIINSSNMGGVYVFGGSEWRVLRPPKKGVSFQLYSMLNWYDKLLIGQYPTGNLFEYDGKQLRHLKDWPPVMPGVAAYSREAQTTCLFGGDLYVGVWPWAELWRYDAFEKTWGLVRRMFERPEATDTMGHPWEDHIKAYNETSDRDIVYNNWGQRVTGLIPMDDALYISVSAKGCFKRNTKLDFLRDDSVWNEYRVVHRMRRPGCCAGAVRWTGKPTTLQFTVTGSRMSVTQDGRELAAAPVTAELAAKARDARIEWGHGMFGRLRGELQSRTTVP